MGRTIAKVVMAVALIGLGWGVGRAQTSETDFELVVDAPAGQVNVTCTKGCGLAWVERGMNSSARPQDTFTFSCSGVSRCGSGKIGGWIRH